MLLCSVPGVMSKGSEPAKGWGAGRLGKHEDLGEGWLLEAQILEAARTECESQLHRPTPCMSWSKKLAIWELSFLICKVGALGDPPQDCGKESVTCPCPQVARVYYRTFSSLTLCRSDSWCEHGRIQTVPCSTVPWAPVC